MSNGVRVATETWNSNLASVTVLVRAGSRNETLENSGVSQYIKNLVLRGTQSKTRSQVESELESLGGNFNVEVSRETTSFTLTVRKEEVANAVNFLGDILTSSLFDKNQLEAERDAILRNSLSNGTD